jgi:hypothetical protein
MQLQKHQSWLLLVLVLLLLLLLLLLPGIAAGHLLQTHQGFMMHCTHMQHTAPRSAPWCSNHQLQIYAAADACSSNRQLLTHCS